MVERLIFELIELAEIDSGPINKAIKKNKAKQQI